MILPRSSKIIIYIILSVFMIATVMPLLWLINLSFKTNQEIIAGNIMSLPSSLNLRNYKEAWTVGKVDRYFLNSVIITFSASLLTLLLGVPMAYGICRMYWKLKNWVFTLVIIGIMIPIHATLVPVFITLKSVNILDSYMSIVLPYTASSLPITVYVARNFLISVPTEMEEAAFIDGCGIIRAFIKIIVPSIKQSLNVIIVLNFLAFWNEFVMASTLIKKPNLYTLPIGLSVFQGDYVVDFGAIAAGVLISLMPVLILYLLFTDLFEKSLVVSSMK